MVSQGDREWGWWPMPVLPMMESARQPDRSKSLIGILPLPGLGENRTAGEQQCQDETECFHGRFFTKMDGNRFRLP